MVFALFLLFAFIFLWFKKTEGLRSYELPLAFLFKILVGVLFMFVYTRIYGVGAETVDWEEFVHDSVLLRNVAFEDFSAYLRFMFGFGSEADVQHYLMNTNHWAAGDLALMNDSRNVLRVNSLIAFLFNGNVYYHISFITFFVVLSFRELYLVLREKVWLRSRSFWWLLILLPSLAFWTASMLKEPFMVMGICLLFSGLFGNHKRGALAWRIILGLVLLLGFKPYVLLCLILPALIYVCYRWFGWSQWLLYTIAASGVAVLFICSPRIEQKVVHQITRMQFDFINVGRGGIHVLSGDNFYFFEPEILDRTEVKNDSLYVRKPVTAKLVTTGMQLPFEDVKLTSDDGPWPVYFEGERCGSYFDISPINNKFHNLVVTAPEALVNAALRPFPSDNGSWLKYFNFAETLFIFGMILFTLFTKRIKRKKEQRQMVILLVVFTIGLLLLIGWTTPIMGALVRYRMPAYLALILIASLGSRTLKLR